MGWIKKRFTNSPVPELSTYMFIYKYIYIGERRAFTLYWLNHLNAGGFHGL